MGVAREIILVAWRKNKTGMNATHKVIIHCKLHKRVAVKLILSGWSNHLAILKPIKARVFHGHRCLPKVLLEVGCKAIFTQRGRCYYSHHHHIQEQPHSPDKLSVEFPPTTVEETTLIFLNSFCHLLLFLPTHLEPFTGSSWEA